jgi:serine/threonine protein kinase
MGNLVALCPTDFYEELLNHKEEGFDNIYKVDEANYIGTGKFAVVHLCWLRKQVEQRFALKVINTRCGDMASLNRIQEEINILQVLGQHPGLSSLCDVDETLPGSIRLVLELCEGGELYDRIQQKQYYPEHEAKIACHNLLEAVAYIHGKGIMHRDLKPENILLVSKVSHVDVKISDFGLAKISRDYPRRLPRSHSICGSDFYLAPEVIKQEEYGREIDIWAVGVIVYVLLSGSLPFFHNVLHKLYRQIVERDVSFPEQAWKNVSKGALDFILRLLQVRAGDRLTAEQALSHPFLRGTNTGSSFTSFDSHNPMIRVGSHANPNYYNAYGHQGNAVPPPISRGPSGVQGERNGPHPLEHAHKVNSKGGGQEPQQSPTPTARPGSPQEGCAYAQAAQGQGQGAYPQQAQGGWPQHHAVGGTQHYNNGPPPAMSGGRAAVGGRPPSVTAPAPGHAYY